MIVVLSICALGRDSIHLGSMTQQQIDLLREIVGSSLEEVIAPFHNDKSNESQSDCHSVQYEDKGSQHEGSLNKPTSLN